MMEIILIAKKKNFRTEKEKVEQKKELRENKFDEFILHGTYSLYRGNCFFSKITSRVSNR